MFWKFSGPSAKTLCQNSKDIEAEGGLETDNENVRDSVESLGLRENEKERPGPRVGMLKSPGLTDKIESDSKVEILGTNWKNVENMECSGNVF